MRLALVVVTFVALPSLAARRQGDSNDASAQEAIQAGRFAEAATQLRAQLDQQPSDPELWNLLGIAQTELHNVRQAAEAFSRGLQLAPNSITLNENAGLFYFREAEYQRAKKLLARAAELGSEKPAVRFSLAGARLRSGEREEALRELLALQSALSQAPEYWDERGQAELAQDPLSAGSSFEHALALAPKDLVALNGAAAAAERQGLDEKALAYLIQARAATPDDVHTLLHFGSVCIRRDLGPDAIQALERVRQLEPSNQNAVYLLARAEISVEKWQEAYGLFAEFSKHQPRFAPSYYAMGWLDIKLNRTADARRLLQRALALDPAMNDARFELAQLELDDGQTETASALLVKVLRNDPNHTRANVALADIKMRQGQLDEARRLLERATQANPRLAAAHYKLSIVCARLHETGQSERERKLAADLATEDKRASKTQLRLVLPDSAAAAASRRSN